MYKPPGGLVACDDGEEDEDNNPESGFETDILPSALPFRFRTRREQAAGGVIYKYSISQYNGCEAQIKVLSKITLRIKEMLLRTGNVPGTELPFQNLINTLDPLVPLGLRLRGEYERSVRGVEAKDPTGCVHLVIPESAHAHLCDMIRKFILYWQKAIRERGGILQANRENNAE